MRIGRGSATFDVTLVEELGAHRLLHGQVAGQAFTAHVLANSGLLKQVYSRPCAKNAILLIKLDVNVLSKA